MISNLTFFESKDLEQVTGLSHAQLWENGFELDDMDWGFCTDLDCFITEYDSDMGFEVTYCKHNAPNYIYRLLEAMDEYCVGYHHTFYNGKHYFTQHHS